MTRPSTSVTVDVATRLRLVVARLHRILRQQAMSDLTLTQLSCMALVGKDGPLSLGDVASKENLAAPTVTKAVAHLESKGLVRRLADPTDRRVSLIATSRSGEELLEQIKRRRAAYLNRRLGRLDDSDLAKIEAALPILERLAICDRQEDER